MDPHDSPGEENGKRRNKEKTKCQCRALADEADDKNGPSGWNMAVQQPEIILDVQLIGGDNEVPVNMEIRLLMPGGESASSPAVNRMPPQISECEFPVEEEAHLTDSFTDQPMTDGDLRVKANQLASQYVHTTVPLEDADERILENEWDSDKRRYSNKSVVNEIERAQQGGIINAKKSPEMLLLSPWGVNFTDPDYTGKIHNVDSYVGHDLHMNYARSHLNHIDRASTFSVTPSLGANPSMASVQTRVMFQIESVAGMPFGGAASTGVLNELAFEMRLAADQAEHEPDSEANGLKVVVQYGDGLQDNVGPNGPYPLPFSAEGTSTHIATVEMSGTPHGPIQTNVHYKEGLHDKEQALRTGGAPLKISVPVGGKMPASIIHGAKILVRNDTTREQPMSLTLRQGDQPVRLSVPVGDDGKGITITAHLTRDSRADKSGSTAVKCTVITDGVPGNTNTKVMQRSGSPFFFDVPRADGPPVRAKLTMVLRDDGLDVPTVKWRTTQDEVAGRSPPVHGPNNDATDVAHKSALTDPNSHPGVAPHNEDAVCKCKKKMKALQLQKEMEEMEAKKEGQS